MVRNDLRRSPITMEDFANPHLPGISGIPRRQPPPLPSSPLVGRDQDLGLLLRLLGDRSTRVVSLLGPGGVGKTRLALTAAHELVNDFDGGVLFIRLDRVTVSTIWEAIGRHLSLSSGDGTSWEDVVTGVLHDRQALLVLDNCESMIEAFADLPLVLDHCPGITVLTTSRETLRLPDEHEIWLTPLPVPDDGRGTHHRQDNPAVQLFVHRASKMCHDFTVTSQNEETIKEIARRLDGLPLALELAAAYLRHLSPDDVLAMLDDAMPALRGGSRTLPERQQSLRDLVRWSLDLLPPGTREGALRLAVFANGFTPHSVAALQETGSRREAWDLLMTLADRSLIQRAPSPGTADARFFMLQTIRGVLLDELERSPELRRSTFERLARSLVKLAREADRRYHGSDGLRWLRTIQDEHQSVQMVLTRSLTEPSLQQPALELCGDMFWFWYTQGHYQWVVPRIEELLDIVRDDVGPEIRARAHVTAGWLAHRMAQRERAERHFRQARELFGEKQTRGSLLGRVGYAYVLSFDRTDSPGAIRELQSVIDAAPAVPNAWHEEAAGHFGIGILQYFDGQLTDAREHFEATIRLGRAHNDGQSIGMSLMYLAHVDRARGDPAEAYWKLREALPLLMEIGDLATAALLLDIVASTLVELDAMDLAMQALALGEHLRATMGIPRAPLELPDAEATRARIDAWMRSSPNRMPADGSTLDLGETIDHLLRFNPATAGDGPSGGQERDDQDGSPVSTVLSPRELEVLHLVSTGMTSPEIAATLFVSPHTVKRHMANIREKLGVRSQAAAIAVLQGRGA